MSWDTDFKLVEVVQRLIEVRLRVERVRLAQRLQSLESRVAIDGKATTNLRDLRKALLPPTPDDPKRVDRALVLPKRPDGVWRKRYLNVQQKPGSVF